MDRLLSGPEGVEPGIGIGRLSRSRATAGSGGRSRPRFGVEEALEDAPHLWVWAPGARPGGGTRPVVGAQLVVGVHHTAAPLRTNHRATRCTV